MGPRRGVREILGRPGAPGREAGVPRRGHGPPHRQRGHGLRLRAGLLHRGPGDRRDRRLDAPRPQAVRLSDPRSLAAGLREVLSRIGDVHLRRVEGDQDAVPQPDPRPPAAAVRRRLADGAAVDVHGRLGALQHLHRRRRAARRPPADHPPHHAPGLARLLRGDEPRGDAQLRLRRAGEALLDAPARHVALPHGPGPGSAREDVRPQSRGRAGRAPPALAPDVGQSRRPGAPDALGRRRSARPSMAHTRPARRSGT